MINVINVFYYIKSRARIGFDPTEYVACRDIKLHCTTLYKIFELFINYTVIHFITLKKLRKSSQKIYKLHCTTLYKLKILLTFKPNWRYKLHCNVVIKLPNLRNIKIFISKMLTFAPSYVITIKQTQK